MLEVENISVFYGDVQVLWDVSFKVEDGQIIAIIGPNGAGKTTTLKTISGLLPPRSGSIKFLGERINGVPPYQIVEAGISQVPEGRRLFPYMTVLENLKLGAYTRGAREKMDETLEWVYDLFPTLKERKNQLAGTLSGGEQQMLAVARGLMSRPKLLMFDEPSLGLAPKLVLKVFEAINQIKQMGVTMLLVEQNVHHALKLANYAYVLETGRIFLHGKGNDLVNNEYVKRAYLGM